MQCEGCKDANPGWLNNIRLDNGVTAKLCPPCVKRVERGDALFHDQSDMKHPDNILRVMPKEVRAKFMSDDSNNSRKPLNLSKPKGRKIVIIPEKLIYVKAVAPNERGRRSKPFGRK